MYFKHTKCVLTEAGKIRTATSISKPLATEVTHKLRKIYHMKQIHFMIAYRKENPGLFAKLLFLRREKLYEVIPGDVYVFLVQKYS